MFTSGGTEADNLAVKGIFWAPGATRTRAAPASSPAASSTTPCSTPSSACSSGDGAEVSWLEPDRCGHIGVDDLRAVLAEHADDVAVVSVMWANNEVGTVQPVAEVVAVAHEHGMPVPHRRRPGRSARCRCDFDASGADLMSVTGPQGRRAGRASGRSSSAVTLALVPLLHGGGQERQVRSGTLDVAGIHAFAVALDETVAVRDVEAKRVLDLRDRLVEGALGLDLGITVSGCWTAGDGAERLPGNAHLLVPGCEGDSLLYAARRGRASSARTGSACRPGCRSPATCSSRWATPRPRPAVRCGFTLGHTSTDADVDAALAALPGVVERARRAGGFG